MSCITVLLSLGRSVTPKQNQKGIGMDPQEWADYAHEEILQAATRHLLTGGDLEGLCAELGLPTLVEADGEPVTVAAAHIYRDAEVLTTDRGVLVELSDGSAFGLSISVSRRPRDEVRIRPPRPDDAR